MTDRGKAIIREYLDAYFDSDEKNCLRYADRLAAAVDVVFALQEDSDNGGNDKG